MVKPGRKPTEFTNEQKAQALAVLAAKEGDLAEASAETGLSVYHLRRLRKAYPELYEVAHQMVVDDIYDKTLVMVDRYADEIIRRVEDPDTLATMKTKDLSVTYGIGVDKLNVMTAVRSKFGEAQKRAEDYSQFTPEQLEKAIDAEFKELPKAEEPESNEDMPDTPKDKFSFRPGSVSSLGSFLRRGSDTG